MSLGQKSKRTLAKKNERTEKRYDIRIKEQKNEITEGLKNRGTEE